MHKPYALEVAHVRLQAVREDLLREIFIGVAI